MVVGFLKYILVVSFILLSVAFFTLFERSVLGAGHLRFGPNKLVFFGVFQPFSDAVKLFSKEMVLLSELEVGVYILFPIFYLFLSIVFWGLFPFWGVVFFSSFSILLLICLMGLGVYFLLLSGWSSGSKYSLLGSFRSSAQSISYEVIMLFIFLIIMYVWFSLELFGGVSMYTFFSGVILMLVLFFLWLISCVAECNRSPFDFSEGESELVSGFNTEYGGGWFSFIFIGEYSFIIVFSMFSSLLFFGPFCMFAVFVLVSYIYLWVRCSLPRLRYDLLMMMSWSSLMIVVLSVFVMYFYYF